MCMVHPWLGTCRRDGHLRCTRYRISFLLTSCHPVFCWTVKNSSRFSLKRAECVRHFASWSRSSVDVVILGTGSSLSFASMRDSAWAPAQMFKRFIFTRSNLDAQGPPIILSTSFLHNLNCEDTLLEVHRLFFGEYNGFSHFESPLSWQLYFDFVLKSHLAHLSTTTCLYCTV